MDKIVELLNEKNFYLEKFLEESRVEKSRFRARQFENLEQLYKKREEILKNIHSIDDRIQSLMEKDKNPNTESLVKNKANTILENIKKNVHFIMQEDLGIISSIEREKSKIIQEIAKSREGRRALKAYKSKSSPQV